MDRKVDQYSSDSGFQVISHRSMSLSGNAGSVVEQLLNVRDHMARKSLT